MAARNWAILVLTGLTVSGCTADNGHLATLVTNPGANSVAPFSLLGVVTEVGGAQPISDVLVKTVPPRSSGAMVRSTLTDAGGAFSFSGLTESTALSFEKAGYRPTGFSAVSTDRVVNVTLHQIGSDFDGSDF